MEAQLHHGYLVGLFDILGFESKFDQVGLSAIHNLYVSLIDEVNRRNDHWVQLTANLKVKEAPYWTKDDIFVFNRVQGAYASDSILLWANRTWDDARDRTISELSTFALNPSERWKANPIPCDTFLNACNELICHSLEIGLPLRGALSMGPAVFDDAKNIFLGRPIIEAARMEKNQRLIGASLCAPFIEQIIPKRYLLSFDRHLKDANAAWGGYTLDWPRHWRKTRQSPPELYISAMNKDRRFSAYYENTLEMIACSEKLASQFESSEDTRLCSVYSDFFSFESAGYVMAVRRIPAEGGTGGKP